MPCFPGTTLVSLIDTSCRRIYSCSTLSCLNTKALHTSCILIGIQHPSGKCFPPIHIKKALLENSSYGPKTAIDGSGPSNEYTGWPNIVYDLVLMNFYTMDPLLFPRALYTVVAKDFSKLSMINTSGGGSFPISLCCALGEKNWCGIHTCLRHFCSTLGLSVFLWACVSVVENSKILSHFHSCFQHHR